MRGLRFFLKKKDCSLKTGEKNCSVKLHKRKFVHETGRKMGLSGRGGDMLVPLPEKKKKVCFW